MDTTLNASISERSYSEINRISDIYEEQQKLLTGNNKTICQRMNKRPCGLLRFRHGIFFNGYTSHLPLWSQVISCLVTLLLLLEVIKKAKSFNQPVTVNQQSIAKSTLASYDYQIEPPSENPLPLSIHIHLHNATEVIGPVSSKIKQTYDGIELVNETYHYDELLKVGVFNIDYLLIPRAQQHMFTFLTENDESHVRIFFSMEPSLAKQF